MTATSNPTNKKSATGFILIFVVILLIGLGVLWFVSGGMDAISSTKEKSDTKGLNNSVTESLKQITEDSKAAMKSATKKAQDFFKQSTEKLQDALNDSKSDSSKDMSLWDKIVNFFKKLFGQDTTSKGNAKINAAKNTADKASKKYGNAKSKDNVFQDSIKKLTENPDDILPYALAVVFVILIVILLLKKPAPKPVAETESSGNAGVNIVIQQPQAAPDTPVTAETYSGRRYENVSDSALTSMCEKYNIPKDHIMSIYHDPDIALARINTYATTANGDVNKIMKRIENDKEA